MKHLFCFLLLMTGCVGAPLSKWHVYDAGPFSFSLPKNMVKTPLRGNDSYAASFKSEKYYLDFDYGAYSTAETRDMPPDASGFIAAKEQINGQEAQIASLRSNQLNYGFHYLISVYFPHHGLQMLVECKSKGDFSTALQIFRSVKFNESEPKTPKRAIP